MSDTTPQIALDTSLLHNWMLENGVRTTLNKKELFSQMGGSTRKVGLVISGAVAMRGYDEKGQYKIFSVAFPGQMISNYIAHHTGNESVYDLVALENSVVASADVGELDAYLDTLDPSYRYKFMAGLAYALMRRIIALKTMSPRTRYIDLLKRIPDIHQRLSMTDISSYLGISRESFQRMKRSLEKGDAKG